MIKTLLSITYSFGKIGLISLGGGNSMLKLLEYEAVTYRHWIGQEEFVSMLGASFLFPGLTVIKLSALIGYKTAGIAGLILAILCLNLPGLMMALLGYRWLSAYNNDTSNKIMTAVQYGALALLASATYSVAQSVVGIYCSIPLVVCSLVFFLALTFWNLSPFYGFIGFIAICFFLIH